MPISAIEIFECATKLAAAKDNSEAFARVIVGRSYYAAYHDCIAWERELAVPGSLPGDFRGGGVHAELAARLMNPAPSLPETTAHESRQRGGKLRSLHGDRATADYKLRETIKQFHANNALRAARDICKIGRPQNKDA